MNHPTTPTVKSRPALDHDNTDSILGLFNTSEHKARVRRARQKQTFHYWKTRLTIDALLVALGFLMGIILF